MTKFYEPTTVQGAVRVLAEHGAAARVVAGGTDVVVSLSTGAQAPPEVLVSVKRVAGLREVDVGDRAVTLGAAVTFGEVLFSEALRERLPALPTVAGKIAGPQIRNMAIALRGQRRGSEPLVARSRARRPAGPPALESAQASRLPTISV